MNPNQPPGWGPAPGQPPGAGFGPPQQGAFGQPAQPAFGQPAQPAFGQPAQPAFGQPAQPAFGQPAQPAFGQPAQPAFGQPAQPAFGQPAQPAFGQPAQPAYGQPASQPGFGGSSSPGSGTFGPPGPAQAPARKVGMFESIPCPHCGMAMRSSSGNSAIAGRMLGGLVGVMIVKALASKLYCPTHGEVPTGALPPEHQSLLRTRRILMIAGAGALFLFAFCLMCVVSAFRSY